MLDIYTRLILLQDGLVFLLTEYVRLKVCDAQCGPSVPWHRLRSIEC